MLGLRLVLGNISSRLQRNTYHVNEYSPTRDHLKITYLFVLDRSGERETVASSCYQCEEGHTCVVNVPS